MNFQGTGVFDKINAAYLLGKRLIVNEGGTSSSKTISTIQFLIFIATYTKKPLLISIVSESFPHLRRGCLRDFKMLMGVNWEESQWSATLHEYSFAGGAKIEFFSADDPRKLRGGRRDILFLNEVNNIRKESFDELDVRTRIFTIVDFNPVSDFYIHEMRGLPHVAWIHSTFLDALHVLEQSVVDNIISRKDRDPNWWRIYGLGLVGKIEGLVHPMFAQCDELPDKGREIYCLDFGYSMDPAALIRLKITDDTIYGDELFYEKGMTNDMIAKRMDELGVRRGQDIIIADSAEPKSIDEIKAYGFDIRPAAKGKDSVNVGIQKVNQYKQIWTKRSLNAIKEQRNYRWEKDPISGKFLPKPIGDWNHAMDARRMGVFTMVEHKILPAVKIRVEPFTLVWDRDKVPETEALHYAAVSMTPDMLLHFVCAVWDCIAGVLYIYHGESVENISPESAVPSLIDLMHLNEFYFEKFLASSKMLSDNRSVARVFNREFNKLCPMQQIKLREPKRFDQFGAIVLAKQMINQQRLVIHESCTDMTREMQHWHVEEGKVEVKGLRESLMMLVSELDQREVIRPHVALGEYKVIREFNY